MLESAVEFLSTVPWYWVLIGAFFFTILENVFPPSPCDSVIIFTGTLVGIDSIDLIPLLLSATAGSTVGFAIMFFLGRVLGKKAIYSKKFSFITEENLEKPNRWLSKYGYYVIAGNRFLSGTRGLISFLAGMSKMRDLPTIALASFSALIWNLILIYAGVVLGENWKLARETISLYGWIIIPAIIAATAFFVAKKFARKKNINSENQV